MAIRQMRVGILGDRTLVLAAGLVDTRTPRRISMSSIVGGNKSERSKTERGGRILPFHRGQSGLVLSSISVQDGLDAEEP